QTCRFWRWDAARQIQSPISLPSTGLRVTSNSSGLIAIGTDNGAVLLWDYRPRKKLGEIQAHSQGVYGLSFHPHSPILGTGSIDGTIRTWEMGAQRMPWSSSNSPDPRHQGPKPKLKPVWCTTFHPSGTAIFSGSNDGTVAVWDAESGALMEILEGHERNVYSIAFSADGDTMVTGSEDTT